MVGSTHTIVDGLRVLSTVECQLIVQVSSRPGNSVATKRPVRDAQTSDLQAVSGTY